MFLISSTSTSLTLCITRVLGEEDDKFDKAEAAATAREAQAQNERTMHANEAREDRETKQNELLARLDEQADLGKQILEQLLTPAKGPRFALDSNVVQDSCSTKEKGGTWSVWQEINCKEKAEDCYREGRVSNSRSQKSSTRGEEEEGALWLQPKEGKALGTLVVALMPWWWMSSFHAHIIHVIYLCGSSRLCVNVLC